uniref:type IX secretion system plug protein n=1 Tax=Prevotella sp. TaxID=59823 RepID=UPI0027E3456D
TVSTPRTIDNAEESINTNTLYTHYSFSIPNERCRPKISGNYRLTVYDENEGDTIFTACFMVVDPLINVSMQVTSNTDIDTNKSHQQVAMTVGYPSLRITNPSEEIKTVVLQNGDWNDARRNVPSQYQMVDGMKWQHNKALIFNGGNEYRKFEILSVSNPTLGIEDTWWDGSQYRARVWTDLPRPSYTYDEDANGAFYIRNSDNIENDRASEYVVVEFRLQAPRQRGDVYINGAWTNNQYIPQYLMTYNEIDKMYEAKVRLKQGYYSYRYVVVDNDKPQPVTSEGNFFQTENTYQALVYYRAIGQRTDLLSGYCEVEFK